MRVLVIEDTVTSATLICNQLRKMNAEPLLARDGESGLLQFRKERPDLILLDIILPGMDGFEVARRIRMLETDGEWTPIIFLTARTSDEDLRRGIELGGDDYLAKPVSEVVLAAKVQAMERIAKMRQRLVSLTRKLDEANRELTRLSSMDGLTGLANRRCFDETLLREWMRAMRTRKPVAVVLLDVDFFKPFNDGYGHQVGDECLKAVARLLGEQIHRSCDLVARYGGEEFVCVLPETDEEGALCIAERLREVIEQRKISHRFSKVSSHVTISAGVCSTIPERGDDTGFLGLLKCADQALYQAKEQGRNRVLGLPMERPVQAF